MARSDTPISCSRCGSSDVEQREEGLYCKACGLIATRGRAVHHEGFPHVVVDENEQEP